MSLTVTGAGGDYEPTPDGVYNAVCVALADVGEEYSERFGTASNKLWIGFEADIDGKKELIWGKWTKSIHAKSKLRPMLESWRGSKFTDDELKEFSLVKILGKPCKIQLMDYKGYTVDNIMPPEAKQSIKTETEQFTFDVEDPKQENLDNLPARIKKEVEKNTGQVADEPQQEVSDEVIQAEVQDIGF